MQPRRDPLSDELVDLISRIVSRYTAEYEATAARHDLTTIQAKVLIIATEPVPMHHLAERLNSERSNVTGIVDRLEARQLVERQPDPRDRRIKNVVATAAGRAAARSIERTLRYASDPFTALNTAEREQLRALLTRIADSPGS
jgi:DNA-binding MarR family transcriptional regulator